MNESSTLERLKQSAVVQAVLVFLGASWVILQVVDVLQERLGLPDWVFPLTLILLAIGFVVVLATSWVQSRPSTTAAEEAGELPTDWEVAPADALASLRAGRIPHLTWGRAIVGGVVSLSLLFGFAGAYVLVTGGTPRIGPVEAGADEAATAIAILPFEVNNPELEEWSEGIVDLLAPGLDGVAGYRTIASRTVLSEWRKTVGDDPPDLRTTLSVGGATGARYGVTGSVVALGPNVRLTAEIFDLADGSKIADGTAEGPAEDVLGLVDELGLDAIRNLMDVQGAQGVDQQLPARITTSSLASARAFLEGEAHYRAGRLDEALRSYQESMEADSTFGLPVLRAAYVLGFMGDAERREAMDRRLERVLDHLAARDRTLAQIKLEVNGDSLQSVLPVERAVANYPDDAEAWFMLGEVRLREPGLAGGGVEPTREAFEKAVELSPGFVPYLYPTIGLAIGMGDSARAEVLLSELRTAVPEDPRIPAFEQALRLLYGDLEAAREEVLEAIGSGGGPSIDIPLSPALIPRVWDLLTVIPSEGEYGLTDMKSGFAMAVGRQREALELLETIPRGNTIRITLARHHQDLIGTLTEFDGDAEYSLENCGGFGSSIACREKVALHAVDRGRFEEARAAIAFQDSAAAVDTLSGRVLIRRRVARFIEGYMAWKQGDIDAALSSLREARRADRFAVTARWFMAEALVEAGQPTAAVDLFLSIDDSPTWVPFAHLRAAEVLEGMGDQVRAAKFYRSALSAWGQADEGFEAKARAEAGLARVTDQV
jgi:tetratricopeptide (TPR) repeat protein